MVPSSAHTIRIVPVGAGPSRGRLGVLLILGLFVFRKPPFYREAKEPKNSTVHFFWVCFYFETLLFYFILLSKISTFLGLFNQVSGFSVSVFGFQFQIPPFSKMCDTIPDFCTPTEGGEEVDALVDRICAEARAEAKACAEAEAKAGAEADVNGCGLPDSELTPLSTPTGAGTGPADNAPLRATHRVPPRLAILIQHALVSRAPKPIAKCVRGLRFG